MQRSTQLCQSQTLSLWTRNAWIETPKDKQKDKQGPNGENLRAEDNRQNLWKPRVTPMTQTT